MPRKKDPLAGAFGPPEVIDRLRELLEAGEHPFGIGEEEEIEEWLKRLIEGFGKSGGSSPDASQSQTFQRSSVGLLPGNYFGVDLGYGSAARRKTKQERASKPDVWSW